MNFLLLPSVHSEETIMKTLFCVVVCSIAAAQAKEDQAGASPEQAYLIPSAVYQEPVVYQAPVVYDMPVVYMAPVTYAAPAPPTCPCQPECQAPSTVVCIGGSGGAYAYSNCGSS